MVRDSFDFAKAPPLLEVSRDAVPEEWVVNEMIDGLVELDWCTVIGVKPGTRSMGTSSQLQARTHKHTHKDNAGLHICVFCAVILNEQHKVDRSNVCVLN